VKTNISRVLYKLINKFKRGYHPRNNSVKNENGDLLANSDNILITAHIFAWNID
jgi:hypothetical protein